MARAIKGVLTMKSEHGDFVGDGKSWNYTNIKPGPKFLAKKPYDSTPKRQAVLIRVEAENGEYWTLQFAASEGEKLRPGARFENAIRFPFNQSSAGLSISGCGRGASQVTGNFEVKRFRLDRSGAVVLFEATFEQYTDGHKSKMTGRVYFCSRRM